jgi:hypothetical protein
MKLYLYFCSKRAAFIVPHLCHIFRACLVYRSIPITWKQVKVTFNPKPWKYDYTEDIAYRHISLSSFLLKTMTKLLERHIRCTKGASSTSKPIRVPNWQVHWNCTSQCGNTHSECCWIRGNIQTRIIPGHKGAFDRTAFYVITRTAERHGTEPAICRWISTTLEKYNNYIVGRNHEGVRG